MATVHPSRAEIVPSSAKHALPPRPASPESAVNREEELRRKLLARKSRPSVISRAPDEKEDEPNPPSHERIDRDAGASGDWKGKELLSEGSGSGFGILGRARRDRERVESKSSSTGVDDTAKEPVTERADLRGRASPRSEKYGSAGRASSRRDSPPVERRRYDRDMERTRSNDRNHRRSISPVPMRANRDSPRDAGEVSKSFIHPDRLRLQNHSQVDRSTRESHSSPRYEPRGSEAGYSAWQARRNGDRPVRDREYRPPREIHGLPPRPIPLDIEPSSSGAAVDRQVDGSTGRSAVAMPPFPPNRRLTAADFEQRRVLRDTMEFSIWPPSPPHPYLDPAEIEEERRARRKERKKSKRSKRKSRYHSDSDTPSSDSEYERRRRRRKEKERRRGDDSLSDEEDRKRYRRSTRSRERSTTLSRRADSDEASDSEMAEEMWVEKGAKEKSRRDEGSGDDEVGPRLPSDMIGKDRFRAHYTGMLHGEAEAMEAYVADGKRIPRRGEVGYDADKIEQFEASGYVMSGNRHKRMNAVRLRKENQVINAEEKRAILKLQREERVRKEGAIVSQFREMLEEKLKEGQDET